MIRYCPESHAIFDGDNDLTRLGKYRFNFSEKGIFTLMNRRGESLYEMAFPVFNKVCSHLLWMLLWTLLIGVTNFFGPTTYLKTTNPLFMALIFFHLFIFGGRLTQLMLVGGVKAICAPPLWIKLTRQFQKGEGIELLKKHKLENHPGLLANLSLIKAQLGESDASKEILSHALEICPKHPALQALYHHLASNEFLISK